MSPHIILATDPNGFDYLSHKGSATRRVWDRRVNGTVSIDAILFEARYHDSHGIEVQVNPEFGSVEGAMLQAQIYARAVGQLPVALRANLTEIIIHRGMELFGGGSNYLLVHSERGQEYISQGILEETVMHEAAHTSLDPLHSKNIHWQYAQQTDGQFITDYARNFPEREDVAESFVLYFGARYRPERLQPAIVKHIETVMGARMAYFDSLNIVPISWGSIAAASSL